MYRLLVLALSVAAINAKPHANADKEWLAALGKRESELEKEGFFKSISDFFHRIDMVTSKRCANLFDESCANGGIPNSNTDEKWLAGLGRRDLHRFKSAPEFLHRIHMVATKRCANLFDEGCANGGIPGANSDEEWLGSNSPGKRCANLFDESCINGGLPSANTDEEWLSGLGRRDLHKFKSAPHFLHRFHMVVTKRCANLFDEGCINGGIPGANSDEEWLGSNSPGKRCANLFDEGCANGGIPGANSDEEWLGSNSPGKRCANLFDEGCANGGIPGANSDEEWLGSNSPGKRCANLFDEGCANGGIPGANSDEEWLGSNSPGKRCANLFDEGCANGGIPGANSDEEWLGSNSPGKRCANLFDEGCANGGIPGANSDEEWLGNNSPGRR